MVKSNSKKGITFIGMPSSGKSVTGKQLAQKLNWKYIDLDKLIFEKEGIHHSEILATKGDKALEFIEEKHTTALVFENLIFSPGGSIIFSPKAMQKIKRETLVIHLGVNEEQIKKRLGKNLYKDGIIGLETKGLTKIIEERLPLYKKYADLYIDTNLLKKEEVLEEVLKKIKNAIM